MEEQTQRAPIPPGSVRVGSVGGVPVLVRTSWFLVAAVLACLLAPQIGQVEPGLGGVWTYVAGLAYAVLLYLTVLLHEAAHALAARHYRLPVRWISLHLLGGHTEMEGEPQSSRQEFVIAVVGPLVSLLVGVALLLLRAVVPEGVLGLSVFGLAVANLVVGVLNLVPGLPLDGGRVLRAAVWRVSGDQYRGTLVAGWGGRVAAVLVLFWPLLLDLVDPAGPDLVDWLLAFMVGVFLWSGASMALAGARVRRRLPSLVARPLARRVIVVPAELPVSEAVRRAQAEQAGAIVLHGGNDQVTGLVNESALLAVPEDRRPWQPVSSVARSLESGLVLPADIAGEALVGAMSTTPAAEYLLIDDDGSIYGVLSTTDVDRAFAEGGR